MTLYTIFFNQYVRIVGILNEIIIIDSKHMLPTSVIIRILLKKNIFKYKPFYKFQDIFIICQRKKTHLLLFSNII
jgi:hypothetical protein